MSYRIKYCYDTGDSENSYQNEVDYITIVHEDKAAALRNLVRIQQHYEFYQGLQDYRSPGKRDALVADKKIEDWYAGNECALALYTDDGCKLQIVADWCGYFETLNWVELEDEDTRINFT